MAEAYSTPAMERDLNDAQIVASRVYHMAPLSCSMALLFKDVHALWAYGSFVKVSHSHTTRDAADMYMQTAPCVIY